MFRWLKEVLGKKGRFDPRSFGIGRSVGRREIRGSVSEAARTLVKRRWERAGKGSR